MAENEIGQYDEVDANNIDIAGISVQENVMRPPAVNNAFRALQGALKRWFRTDLFRLRDSTDQTKLAAFNFSGNPTATTRTYDLPFYSGTLAIAADIRGQLFGLTLSNNVTDATNDIDITTGVATNDTATVSMVLASALTKRLDAAWAVGTNQGGLDTGAISNGTYHVFLIRRPDTGVVDVLFSAALAPTMPANYTQKRRIGSILRESAAIVAFWQNGDSFERAVVVDRNSVSPTAAALLTVSVPAGIVVQPLLALSLAVGASSDAYMQLGSVAAGSGNLATVLRTQTGASDLGRASSYTTSGVYSNTSRQVYFAQLATGGTITVATVFTYGWIDDRGRSA